MTEFTIRNDRVKKPYIKVITILFGLFLLAVGVIVPHVLGLIAGPLFLWSAVFRKITTVSEAGVRIHYDARLFQYDEHWPFSQITNIHQEAVPDPALRILHVTKGDLSKRLVLHKEDAARILEMARTANPSIHFGEAR